jgi:hypothetical protein
VFLMVWNLNKKPYLLFPSRTERPLPVNKLNPNLIKSQAKLFV